MTARVGSSLEAEAVRQRYEPRILGTLARVADECRDRGLDSGEIVDLCDDEYRWVLSVGWSPMTKDEDRWTVTFTIEEEVEHAGEGDGLSFAILVSKPQGAIAHDLEPGRYTPEAWCRTEEEIEARFQDLASPAVACMIADTIAKWED